jgi:peptidoglycan/LPS O-acetylase OafA/YrhL
MFELFSGLLTMYGSIIHFKSMKKFNLLVYVLHRVWRFLPLLMLTLSLTFIMQLIGSGPIWRETMQPVVDSCHKNWWKNLLFINYLVDSENIVSLMKFN